MADEAEAFKSFAAEVRGSYSILTSKLKAIKMSTDEAMLRLKYKYADEEATDDALKLLKTMRPETPKNIRALYRAVTKDVVRIREAFEGFPAGTLNAQDQDQVGRIIADLERQLRTRTVELENLKAGKSTDKSKSARLKSARGKSARGKSARQSAKRLMEKQSPAREDDAEDGALKTLPTTQRTTNHGEQEDENIFRQVTMPPVMCTNVTKATGSGAVLSESRITPPEREKTYRRERAWGAFHGQKTLSRRGTELSIKLPAANTAPSLVSSGSQVSESESCGESLTTPRPKVFSESPTVKLKRMDITISHSTEPSKMTREQTKFQETRKAARLNYKTRDRGWFLPSPRNYSRHDAAVRPEKMERNFTSLEKVDLNNQVGGTVKSTSSDTRHMETKGLPGRRPSYLVNRSRTVPHVNLANKKARLPKSVVAFGRCFSELPLLKRDFTGLNPDVP